MTSTAQATRDALTAEQILLLDAAVVGGAGLALLPLRRPVAALLTGNDDAAASSAPLVAAAGGVFTAYALAVVAGVKGGQTARVLPAVAVLNSIWVAASAVLVLLSRAVPQRTPLQPASGTGVAVISGVAALVAWFAAVQWRLLRRSE